MVLLNDELLQGLFKKFKSSNTFDETGCFSLIIVSIYKAYKSITPEIYVKWQNKSTQIIFYAYIIFTHAN